MDASSSKLPIQYQFSHFVPISSTSPSWYYQALLLLSFVPSLDLREENTTSPHLQLLLLIQPTQIDPQGFIDTKGCHMSSLSFLYYMSRVA